jgi:hypothetical protein
MVVLLYAILSPSFPEPLNQRRFRNIIRSATTRNAAPPQIKLSMKNQTINPATTAGKKAKTTPIIPTMKTIITKTMRNRIASAMSSSTIYHIPPPFHRLQSESAWRTPLSSSRLAKHRDDWPRCRECTAYRKFLTLANTLLGNAIVDVGSISIILFTSVTAGRKHEADNTRTCWSIESRRLLSG